MERKNGPINVIGSCGAPVGSLICGPKSLIEGKIHRYRKMFGGGMRQAGIIAAAGIYALEHNVERLAEDHKNAKTLADAINSNEAFALDIDKVESNIIIFDINPKFQSKIDAEQVASRFAEKDVFFSPVDRYSMRIVTHLDVEEDDIKQLADMVLQFKV